MCIFYLEFSQLAGRKARKVINSESYRLSHMIAANKFKIFTFKTVTLLRLWKKPKIEHNIETVCCQLNSTSLRINRMDAE